MSFTDIEKDNLMIVLRRQDERINALHDSNLILLDRVQELDDLVDSILWKLRDNKKSHDEDASYMNQ